MLVDAETHIIVSADVTNQANDSPHLSSQIEQVIENTGRKPLESSADAGYYSDDNVEFLKCKEIEPYIPPDKIKHSEWREQKSPVGRLPKNICDKDLMRKKLRTIKGRKRYKLRQTSLEPVFGFIKEQFGLRQFLLRGLQKVRSMWRFTCAVHNLLKIFRAKARQGMETVMVLDKITAVIICIWTPLSFLGYYFQNYEFCYLTKMIPLQNKSVLVLCPKKLSDNWNTYKLNLLNNPIASDRLRYDVLYHTDLSRTRGYSNGIPLDRLNWSNYDLVVIGESHNFINGGQTYGDAGEKENRYLRLLRFPEREKPVMR